MRSRETIEENSRNRGTGSAAPVRGRWPQRSIACLIHRTPVGFPIQEVAFFYLSTGFVPTRSCDRERQ